ncbi:MAG TPA: ABC-type transport auxiliary lipoprotein family protein [Burkholderiales bacterium]|nr:ABC-type transport auxiliary lipoprotein family protein [Burkholderiales bacterium]
MRPTAHIGIALLVSAIAACASAPATLVTLPAPPNPEAHQANGRSAGTTILLRPVVLPAYLDNFPVVVGRTGNTLIVANDTEWAEPLRDAAARVLRDALSRRLGASRVLIAGDGRLPDADLSIEFLALDPRQGVLRLDAAWSFSCTGRDRRGRAGRTSLEVLLASPTPAAVASATADALGRLADVLAAQAECDGREVAR